MRHVIPALLVLMVATAPAVAQSVPPDDHICFAGDARSIPLGIFTVLNASTYEWTAVGLDRAPKQDASNGSGSYHIEGNKLVIEDGAMAVTYAYPSAEIDPYAGGTQFYFANLGGIVFNCYTM